MIRRVLLRPFARRTTKSITHSPLPVRTGYPWVYCRNKKALPFGQGLQKSQNNIAENFLFGCIYSRSEYTIDLTYCPPFPQKDLLIAYSLRRLCHLWGIHAVKNNKTGQLRSLSRFARRVNTGRFS